MWRKIYHAVLGIVVGVSFSAFIAPIVFGIVGMFVHVEGGTRPFAFLFGVYFVVAGAAGSVFGLRWGGYRLGGRAKRQGIAAIVGGLLGVPCGVLLAVVIGMLKCVIFTVPGCFVAGLLWGAAIGGADPPESGAKQDEEQRSRP